jgi:hypothetical protein
VTARGGPLFRKRRFVAIIGKNAVLFTAHCAGYPTSVAPTLREVNVSRSPPEVARRLRTTG